MRLSMNFDRGVYFDGFARLDILFIFILLSCPILEIFDLDVKRVNCIGYPKLDFTRNTHLKQIKIKQRNCSYYAFKHEPGKR